MCHASTELSYGAVLTRILFGPPFTPAGGIGNAVWTSTELEFHAVGPPRSKTRRPVSDLIDEFEVVGQVLAIVEIPKDYRALSGDERITHGIMRAPKLHVGTG